MSLVSTVTRRGCRRHATTTTNNNNNIFFRHQHQHQHQQQNYCHRHGYHRHYHYHELHRHPSSHLLLPFPGSSWPFEKRHDDEDNDGDNHGSGRTNNNDTPFISGDSTNPWHHSLRNTHSFLHPRRLPLPTHRPNVHPTLSSSSSFSTSSPPAATAIQTRSYRATAPKPILPLLAAGVVGLGAVYTFRALRQMDEDWEEYYEQVEEYRRVTGVDLEGHDAEKEHAGEVGEDVGRAEEGDLAAYFRQGALAIDMGSTRLKLSHRSPRRTKNDSGGGDEAGPAPTVGVDREGARSTPNLIWFEGDDGEGNVLFGRLAASHHAGVVNPREALFANHHFGGENDSDNDADNDATIGNGDALAIKSAREAIRIAASDVLDQLLGSSNNNSNNNPKQTHPLFALDPSLPSTAASYNVRPILTYPPDAPAWYLERYRKAVDDLTVPPGIAAFVPEPVAAVAGADYYGWLPPKANAVHGGGDSVLVVDVGGTCTTISLVSSSSSGTNGHPTKEILYSATLPSLGGDTFIDLLVGHLIQSFYGTDPYHQHNDDTAPSPTSPPSSKPTLPHDPQALPRLYESSAAAVHELTRKSRTHINVPYLTVDFQSRQPRHLEMGVARHVVESEVDWFVSRRLVPYYSRSSDASSSSSILSNAIPPPKDLTTLLSSAVLSALERTSHTPSSLRGMLLVGGGARIPMVRRAMKETVQFLTGGDGMFVAPEGEMAEELVVLGAVVWGTGGR